MNRKAVDSKRGVLGIVSGAGLLGLLLLQALGGHAGAAGAEPGPPSPVLVELFTSEGCSSCPPADRLLEKLGHSRAPNGAEILVLSEHVDYWNHIGWKDPFSSAKFSERQQAYASRFRLGSVYTPQMVVDGAAEFVGSEAGSAKEAIAEAARKPKLELKLAFTAAEKNQLRVEVGGEARPEALQGSKRPAGVYVALVSATAESKVLRGENGGRQLHHVAVVRSLAKLGDLKQGTPFSAAMGVGRDKRGEWGELRAVAFVQEDGQGKVLGAASLALPATSLRPEFPVSGGATACPGKSAGAAPSCP